MEQKNPIHISLVFVLCLAFVVLVAPAMAASTQVQIAKYAHDGTTILAEQTLTWQQMQDTLHVLGDGVTHHYHQGPVFVDNPDPVVEEQLRWNPKENTSILEKDMGGDKGYEAADLENWYYYVQGSEYYPTTTGLSSFVMNRIFVFSDDAPSTTPVAVFSAPPLYGAEPLIVQFTDVSTGTPSSLTWDFTNDGSVDFADQSQSHICDTAGTYTMNLTVNNESGSDPEVKIDYFTVSTPSPALIWGPYLTGTTTTGIVVNAKTNIATALSVEYATDAFYAANLAYDQSATSSVTDTLHHVSLAGLAPDTLYHYRVVYAGQPTADLHFSTFPESGAFTFVVYSDTQDQLPTYSQIERHKLVADRIAEEPDVAFVLNSGDLVNNASDLADWDRYFTAGSMMMANTTVYPALGNHDANNTNYYRNYGVSEYYSFDCGDAHVAVLDSNIWADYQVQGTWLANDLQSDKQFKFVSFHHPFYTSESNHFGGWTNLKEVWESDINDNDVLSVFNGHVHAYERFLFNDTNYYVAGIGGGPSYNLAVPRYTGSLNSLEYMIGYIRVTVDPAARSATAQVIRVADVSTDLKSLTSVYPEGTVFETVVMSLPELPVAPVANFSSDTQKGAAPLTVQFTDASTGTGPLTYDWDFNNDGVTDTTLQNPSYVYTSVGTFTVKLSVTGPGGNDDETKINYIKVSVLPPPIALPGISNPPTDPDNDDLYEDLNANGVADWDDAVVLFWNTDWIIENEPVACFDFNHNGFIDWDDAVVLFWEVYRE